MRTQVTSTHTQHQYTITIVGTAVAIDWKDRNGPHFCEVFCDEVDEAALPQRDKPLIAEAIAAKRKATIAWVGTSLMLGGRLHRAIRVDWSEVERLLGRGYDGEDDDDREIVAALLRSGAPEWAHPGREFAEGDTQAGWYTIGPAVEYRERTMVH